MQHADLFVIGAGSGGLAAAKRTASYGASVIIAEKDRVGGTCVIRGCVPKKMMVNAATFSDALADAAGYGFDVMNNGFNFSGFVQRRNAEVDRLNTLHISLLEKAGVRLVTGHAELVDAHTVRVGQNMYTANKILIATGGHPTKPDVPGTELGITSDELWSIDTLPARMAVVGAGYIGVEFAGIFAALGSKVDLIYRHDLPLRDFDREVAGQLVTEMAARGVTCHASQSPASLVRTNGGILLTLTNGMEIEADTVVFATGRAPNTANIGLNKVGIKTHPNGTIIVNDRLETNVPDIFAVGDMANAANLTPVAIRDGRIFADTHFGNKPRIPTYDTIATAIFSTPPIGTVGMSEEQARHAYHDDVQIYKARFRPMVHTFTGREEKVFMKLITRKSTQKVLGMHMIGRDAAEIIQGFALAVTHGMTKVQLDAALAIHPTSAEEFVTMA
ncbi:MAG: glutathione-disulfide reductase [Proteobacteria bacterium]|nr:glutathione-disulfide reductase [Pseudomonadota bacterium]